MAFVNKYLVATPTIDSPTGHTQDTTETAISGINIEEDIEFTLPCSGFVAATPSAGFDAMFTDIETAVDSVISTTYGIDTTGNSVDYTFLVTYVSQEDSEDKYVNDANRNLVIRGTVKIKVY